MRIRERFILLVALLMLLSVPTPAAARSTAPDLPPLPEWPVIGPILRSIGVGKPEPTPSPMPTPDPDLPTYRPTTFDEGWEIWQELEEGKRVRVVIAEDDVNRALQEQIADWPEVLEAEVAFGDGTVTGSMTVDRSLLDKALDQVPVNIPFLPQGQTLEGEAELVLGAASCRLTVDVTSARLNGRSFLLRRPLGRTLNGILDDYWPNQGCLEYVAVESETLTAVGYK